MCRRSESSRELLELFGVDLYHLQLWWENWLKLHGVAASGETSLQELRDELDGLGVTLDVVITCRWSWLRCSGFSKVLITQVGGFGGDCSLQDVFLSRFGQDSSIYAMVA